MISRGRSFPRFFWLILIFLAVIWLPFLGLAITGNFASRIFPYVMFARNYLAGTPFYYPTADILVAGKKTICFLDFPFISLAVFFLKRIFSGADIVLIGKLVSVIATFFSLGLILKITSRLVDEYVARWACVFFALSPLNLLYGSSFQNEALCLFFLLLCIHQTLLWAGGKSLSVFLWAALFLGLAETGRIHYGYALLPLAWYIYKGSKKQRFFWLILFIIFSQLLPILWYVYCYWGTKNFDNVIWSIIYQAGHKGSSFLWTKEFITQGIKNILIYGFSGAGLFYFLIGVVSFLRKKNAFMVLWIYSAGLPILFLSKKIIDHNYYLYALLPLLAIVSAMGMSVLLRGDLPQRVKGIILVLSLPIYLSGTALTFYKSNLSTAVLSPKILHQAQFVKENTGDTDRVIYAGLEPETMLYSERSGWNLSIPPNLPNYLKQNLEQWGGHDEVRILTSAKGLLPWVLFYEKQGAQFLVIKKAWLDSSLLSENLSPIILEEIASDGLLILYRIKNIKI